MALEFICFSELHEFFGGELKVPVGATHYRCKGRKVKFYKTNPFAPENWGIVPDGAESVKFWGILILESMLITENLLFMTWEQMF